MKTQSSLLLFYSCLLLSAGHKASGDSEVTEVRLPQWVKSTRQLPDASSEDHPSISIPHGVGGVILPAEGPEDHPSIEVPYPDFLPKHVILPPDEPQILPTAGRQPAGDYLTSWAGRVGWSSGTLKVSLTRDNQFTGVLVVGGNRVPFVGSLIRGRAALAATVQGTPLSIEIKRTRSKRHLVVSLKTITEPALRVVARKVSR